MITLRAATERHRERRSKRTAWYSFRNMASTDVYSYGFGALERFDEYHLDIGASILLRPPRTVEIITYVVEGEVHVRESTRVRGSLQAGEFQRWSGEGASQRQTNASRSATTRVFHLWFRHDARVASALLEQKRFSTAERRGELRVVAAHDGRSGSHRVHSDVLVYSAIIEAGQHLVHELGPRRSAWLHVVDGEALLPEARLRAGDAASFTLERAVSLTAKVASELLLVELAHLRPAGP